MQTKLPTYADIAEVASVSTMTVCNVLRGRAGVTPAKREQVLAALETMGLPRSAVLRPKSIEARKRRTRTILLVESGVPRGAWEAPVYTEILRGAEERCATAGWSLQVKHLGSPAELSRVASEFNGSGILLFGASIDATILQKRETNVSLVRVLGSAHANETVDQVTYDDVQVGALAARHLLARGCSRLAFLGSTARPRAVSFAATAAQLGAQAEIFCDESLFASSEGRQLIRHEVLAQLWEKARMGGATGVLVHSDQVAVAFQGLLLSLGLKPQQDVHFVSCNHEEPFLSLLHPRPPSVDIHAREIGRRSIERLFWRMENPDSPHETLIMSPRLAAEPVEPAEPTGP